MQGNAELDAQRLPPHPGQLPARYLNTTLKTNSQASIVEGILLIQSKYKHTDIVLNSYTGWKRESTLLYLLLWQSTPKDIYSATAIDPVFIRVSIPSENQLYRKKYVSCPNTRCLDTLRLQSALQQQKQNCSVFSHFCWLRLVGWHRLDPTWCLASIIDVQTKIQTNYILICSQIRASTS